MQSNLRAVTDVTRTPNGFRARLRTVSPTGSGERVLEHTRCELLADSVAVVIALAMTTKDEARDDRGSPLTVAASAHASTLIGLLPKPTFGMGAALALEAPALRFELRGTFHMPQSTTFEGSTLGARFSAISFAARGCWVSIVGAFDLGPCLGIDVQIVSASGFGGEVRGSGRAISWGPALGMFGRLHFGKVFGVVVVAEAAIPLYRRRFVFEDVASVLHRASIIAAQLLVAPEVQF
jgi:hypothetical protein